MLLTFRHSVLSFVRPEFIPSLRACIVPGLLLAATLSARADRTISEDFTQDGGTFVVGGILTIDEATLTLTNGADTSGITNVIASGTSSNLEILDGSTMTNNGTALLGFGAGSDGSATIAGAGSSWTVSGGSGGITVGSGGHGEMQVEAGGSVSSTQGITIGTTGSGSVTVTGTGSGLNCSSGGLTVGNTGAGNLQVEAGATVSSASALIGRTGAGSGSVTVTGTGSQWNITAGNLVLAGTTDSSTATGELTIANGGLVAVSAGTTQVHANGAIHLGVGGSLQTMSLSTTGAITLELGGTGAGEYGVFDVSGALTLGGTLDILQADDFTPTYGDSFQIFSFDTVSGSFSSVTAFDLSDGLAWDFSRLESDGVISVVPEPSAVWLLTFFGAGILLRFVAARSRGAQAVG